MTVVIILIAHRACRGKHLTLLVRFPNQGRQMEDIELWSHTNETIGQLRRQLMARLAAAGHLLATSLFFDACCFELQQLL